MAALRHLADLPAPSITLALGGLTTGYILWGNVTDYQRGVIPFLNGRLGPNTLDERSRVKLWKAYFKSAAAFIVGSSGISATLNFTTAYIHPSAPIRSLALASGIASCMILPITALVGLLPVNDRLLTLAQEGDKEAEFKKDDEGRELIAAWESKHLRRMPSYIAAFVFSFSAIVLDGRI
ncbi:hypothetical protein IAU60_006790 [Kwoniella sp. DSM 27419]